MADEIYNEVTNRLHSVRESESPKTNHIVTGADEVYDDVAPYRTNGHIECNEVTPTGTENPQELEWYEKVYDTLDPTSFEWIPTTDTIVDGTKTYGVPTGAKQSAINKQMYSMLSDISGVVIHADDANKVITSDSSKIINKDDGYVPTAAAVGNAIGANFEDNLYSTSTVKGLTANMGRVLNENKADINGYYETMSVGSAKNLDGETVNSEAYLIRPTGGESNEVANGVASVLGMEGNSIVWNQQAKTSDSGIAAYRIPFDIDNSEGSSSIFDHIGNPNDGIILEGSFIQGHKYYIKNDIEFTSEDTYNSFYDASLQSLGIPFNIGSRIGTASMTGTDGGLRVAGLPAGKHISGYITFIVHDLTLMFGAGNEPATVAEFEAWLAQHVGTKPYYAYNTGTILSAQTLGFKTYSRNLLNPSNGSAKLIPYTHTTNSNKYTVKGIPTGAAVTYTPDNTEVAVDVTSTITDNTFDISSYGSGTLYIPNATADTYVCMKYDGTMDNEIVPYKDNIYNFDVRKVYGKASGVGEYVQCFPNGMRSTGSVRDDLKADKASVNIGSKMLNGTENWYYTIVGASRTPAFVTVLNDRATGINLLTPKYSTYRSFSSANIDKAITGYYHVYEKNICICDRSYDSTIDFANALSTEPLELLYELATPITYTDLIYRDNGIDRPLSNILMNIEVNNWSIEEQLITPYENGNPTSIPATIQTKYSIDAVEAIKTLEEITYTETEVRTIFSNLLTCLNGEFSEELGGTFVIKDNVPPTPKVFDFEFVENASTNSTEENTETI